MFGLKKHTLPPHMRRASIDQLHPGHYIELEGGWLSHNFVLSSMMIDSGRLIEQLREAGITHVLVDTQKSSIPFPKPPDPVPAEQAAAEVVCGSEALKTALLHGADMRRRQEAAEENHRHAIEETQAIMKNLLVASPAMAARTQAFVDSSVDLVMSDNVAMHLLSGRQTEMSLRFHSLQVMTLALLTGKRLGLDKARLSSLATAALLHDVGIGRLQDRVRMSHGQGTRIEQQAYQMHVLYSVEMIKGNPAVTKEMLAGVLTHHEAMDGSGYPNGIAGEQLPLFGRILAICDRYDLLVNPAAGPAGITPSEALARMFRNEAAKYDTAVLHAFAKSIGIYPPGSVVQLSDGRYGLVIGVNTAALMMPSVLVYEPSVPKLQAPVIDLLEENSLNIKNSVAAALIPQPVFDYLNPRGRVAYFYARKLG